LFLRLNRFFFKKFVEKASALNEKYQVELKQWEMKMIAIGKMHLVRRKTIDQVKEKTQTELEKNENSLERIEKKQMKLRESLKASKLKNVQINKKKEEKSGQISKKAEADLVS
jgi:hypothetical protein